MKSWVLEAYYGSLFMVRPPVPVTVNKAGANYKSEVAHLTYFPREAFREWIGICDGIVGLGGDALFLFEPGDSVYLDKGDLDIDARGDIRAHGSPQILGNLEAVQTGRVFTANGPWVIRQDNELLALMPNMLAHRRTEQTYYRKLLTDIAQACDLSLDIYVNPYRWEGLADVAVVGDQVVFTYTTEDHYSQGLGEKTLRSSFEGSRYAADFAGLSDEQSLFVELVYPHFHGDTVHFGMTGGQGESRLAHFSGGLWHEDGERLAHTLGPEKIVPIHRADAVDAYAANARQVGQGLLAPFGVSELFTSAMQRNGLTVHPLKLYELFGKAGGGPGCATLFLPNNLALPAMAPMRYSQRRKDVQTRLLRIPEQVHVHPDYFAGKHRG